MRKLCRWILLFSKRLFRSVPFWILLLVIPVLSVTFTHISQTEPAVARILIVQRDPADPVSSAIVTQLADSQDTVSFALAEDAQAAYEQVLRGKADALWIFPDAMTSVLEDFSQNAFTDRPIEIFQKEDTVVLRLARERLNAAIYNCCSRYVYLHFLRETAPETEDISDEELLHYWNDTAVSGTLFTFTDLQGMSVTSEENYLLQPFRGLLAVLGTMLSIVVALQFQKDLDGGKYAAIPKKSYILLEFTGQLTAAFYYGLAMLIAVMLSNDQLTIGRELVRVLIFGICSAAFGILLRSLLNDGRILVSVMPALAILMLLVGPVLVSFRQQQYLQWLFPPTYFLMSSPIGSIILCGVLYSAGALLLGLCIRYFKSKILAR